MRLLYSLLFSRDRLSGAFPIAFVTDRYRHTDFVVGTVVRMPAYESCLTTGRLLLFFCMGLILIVNCVRSKNSLHATQNSYFRYRRSLLFEVETVDTCSHGSNWLAQSLYRVLIIYFNHAADFAIIRQFGGCSESVKKAGEIVSFWIKTAGSRYLS